jgi:hypothetical protein
LKVTLISLLLLLPIAAATLMFITVHLCWKCHVWQAHYQEMYKNQNQHPSQILYITTPPGG